MPGMIGSEEHMREDQAHAWQGRLRDEVQRFVPSPAAVPIPVPARDWDEFFLLVCPREETRIAMQRVARKLGCLSFECASVAEAMEYLRQTQFLLVVCDEHLPDGDWTTLLAETERFSYSIGMVVISGSTVCGQQVEALRLDGHDVAAAPVSVDEIRRVVYVGAAKLHLTRAQGNTWRKKPPTPKERGEPPARTLPATGE